MGRVDEVLLLLAVLILIFCFVYLSTRRESLRSVRQGNHEHAAGTISQDLLDILVCPLCKKQLVLKHEGQSLQCTECRRVYPIREGIPILIVEEGVIEDPEGGKRAESS